MTRTAIFTPLNSLISAQVFFIIIGLTYLDFSVSLLELIVTVVVAVITEYALSRVFRPQRMRWFFPGSAVAAGLGIVIFFRAVSPVYFAVAAFLAIASKYIFATTNGRHVFNPSNFGIVFTAFFFSQQTTIELSQWGGNIYPWLFIGVIALLIAYQARVIITTLSFLATYLIIFLVLWNSQVGISFLQFGGLLCPSLIIFASFMITDPKSSPQGWRQGIIHGMSVSLLYFFLEAVDTPYALFVAAFIIALLNGIFSHWFTALKKQVETMFLPQNMATALVVLTLFVSMFGDVVFKSVTGNEKLQDESASLSYHFLLFGR